MWDLYKFVLKRIYDTRKVCCDKVLKVVKLGNEILFQYYHEKVISVVGSRQSQKVIWCWADY